ncbi:hypothetical protein niasHS_012945 [Heterodera schachtii]|uniref:ShKT domain-containing protein n=1 Tax=Heterodera schachtii TaxID=97005 RepID=A0ABD2IXF5_HETSC
MRIVFSSLTLIIFLCIFTVSGQSAENATESVPHSVPNGKEKPNYAICARFGANKQRACRIMVHNLFETRKAEREGKVAKEDDLLPPSIKIGLPTSVPSSRAAELLDEKPPPKVQAEKLACLNLTCFCSYVDGISSSPAQCSINGKSYGKALRMEYRMLSDEQRDRFHSALLKLKHLYNGSSEYDRLAFLHSGIDKMPSAHGGPTFPLWHREYLKRLEFGLRSIDPSVALPYWDSSLDQGLPNPADSIIWTDKFMGSKNDSGYVIDGFLANWITPDDKPVQRRLAPRNGDQGSLLTVHQVDTMINKAELDQIFAFTTDGNEDGTCQLFKESNDLEVLEINHNNVHIWMGGHMEHVGTAPYDPIFFLHHTFIDYIWEQWRLRTQHSFSERETDFPPHHQIKACSAGVSFFLDTPMVPFIDPPLQNRVGLSNAYTSYLYNYKMRPTCSSTGGCGSPYLFCDTTNGKSPNCYSKIKLGGNCSKFSGNGEESCYGSACVDGICQRSTKVIVPPMVHISSELLGLPTERVCYDNHECCAYWAGANQTCKTAPQFMNVWCAGTCGFDGCHSLADPKRSTVPTDLLLQCKRWAVFPEHLLGTNATISECQRNLHWMAQNCPEACAKKTDKRQTLLDKCSQMMPKDSENPSLDD